MESTGFEILGRHDILEVPIFIIVHENYIWSNNLPKFLLYLATATGRIFLDLCYHHRYKDRLIGEIRYSMRIGTPTFKTTHCQLCKV